MRVSAGRSAAFATIDDLAGHDGIENVELLVQDQQVGIAAGLDFPLVQTEQDSLIPRTYPTGRAQVLAE